jgi:alpha 1,3-glucosidase
MLASHPKELVSKFVQVSGGPQLPPYFSIGYHQSRWSYYSAIDVANIIFMFDSRHVPFDAIWLDIDVTNEFEYFTWHSTRYSNESIDIMMEDLNATMRKAVVISDPHIRKNDSYYLYQVFKQLENTTSESSIVSKDNYLVKDSYKFNQDDDTFVGNCWPGNSVWPDYLQTKVRQLWATLYSEDPFYKKY